MFKPKIMSNIVIEDVPESIKSKFWEKTSFNNIVWLYWDWTDWCQYWEIIPTNDDIKAYKASNVNYSKWEYISENDFFKKLS